MKILHLPSSFFPQSTGGKEVLVYQWIKNIPATTHLVVIHGAEPRTYQHEHINVVVLPLPLPINRVSYFSKVYESLGGFENLLDEFKPDIVHFHDQNEGGSLSHLMACQNRGIKTIVTYHSPGQSCMQRAQLFAGKQPCDARIDITRCTSCRYQSAGVPAWLANAIANIDFPFDKYGRFNLRVNTNSFYASWQEFYTRVDVVHIYSRWLEKVLLLNNVSASKIFYTEMGGHAPHGSKEKEQSSISTTLKLVFVGRCTPIKGVHLLIDAVQKLDKNIPIEVHFFGPYFDQSDYGKALQKKVKNDDRFKKPRLVPPNQVIEELEKMDVCVIPSLWPETGPLSVFDAFAANLPIIGTRHAGIAERIKDKVDGLLFDWGSADDLAAKIKLVAIDKGVILKLKDRILVKSNFNLMAVDIFEVYKSILK